MQHSLIIDLWFDSPADPAFSTSETTIGIPCSLPPLMLNPSPLLRRCSLTRFVPRTLSMLQQQERHKRVPVVVQPRPKLVRVNYNISSATPGWCALIEVLFIWAGTGRKERKAALEGLSYSSAMAVRRDGGATGDMGNNMRKLLREVQRMKLKVDLNIHG